MANKVRNIVIWVALATYIVVALNFASSSTQRQVCSEVELVIQDTTRNNFISKKEVVELIEGRIGRFLGYSADSINVALVEEAINQHPAVKSAEVYKTTAGVLVVEVVQRNPIIRVYSDSGEGFYIDIEGAIMPLSANYTARVLIVNGNIPALVVNRAQKTMIADLPARYKVLTDIYTLGTYMYNNAFWKAQIEQVYIGEKGEFELTPRVGMQQILLGDCSDYETKLRKLKTLYTEGFKQKGWNKYKRINLKYKGQVVCEK